MSHDQIEKDLNVLQFQTNKKPLFNVADKNVCL